MKGLSWKTCLIYIDDIIVVGKTVEDHMKNLEEVIEKLRSANFKLISKKCHLLKKEVHYLGHIVSGEGLAVELAKITAV